jgi:hypothetical protein
VAFRLVWEGVSDLDLFVVDPAGGCIDFTEPRSATGGILDIDCNSGTDRLCPHPIENVFWPPGTAPAGTYTYWVSANSLIASEAPLHFELQLLRGKEVVCRQQGSIGEAAGTFGPFVYAFSPQRHVAPVAGGGPLPVCADWLERQRRRARGEPDPAPATPPPAG